MVWYTFISAEIAPSTTVLNVSSGTGTIGLWCFKFCKQVYGLEIVPQAIEDAKHNAEVNAIKNSRFSVGSADDLISTMVEQANIVMMRILWQF